jgi:hypothetical protein
MKQNPAEQTIRSHLEPGALSIEGFLGHDNRAIDEIIATDMGEVEAAGLTLDELGAFLESLHITADEGWEGRVPMFDGKISVRSDETLGQIPCPFTCGAHCHKAVIGVKDGSGKDLLHFTPLDAHLIRAHGFFQGKGSAYRIEPANLIALYRSCRS